MKPAIEHFHQRPVDSVRTTSKSGAWTIVFEGGGDVTNHDETIEKPELAGLALITTIYHGDRTTLQFGRIINGEIIDTVEVVLNPFEYSVRAAGSDERHYPQRQQDELEVVPAPAGRDVSRPEAEEAWETGPVATERYVDPERDAHGNLGDQ